MPLKKTEIFHPLKWHYIMYTFFYYLSRPLIRVNLLYPAPFRHSKHKSSPISGVLPRNVALLM